MNFGGKKGSRRRLVTCRWSFHNPALEPRRTGRPPTFDTKNNNDSTKGHRLSRHEQISYQATKGIALRLARRRVPGVWPVDGKLGCTSCDPMDGRWGNKNL